MNEHTGICGDCWDCRNDESEWTEKDFAAEKCVQCEKRKFNPCPCGTLKHKKGDIDFEIDKFQEVVVCL